MTSCSRTSFSYIIELYHKILLLLNQPQHSYGARLLSFSAMFCSMLIPLKEFDTNLLFYLDTKRSTISGLESSPARCNTYLGHLI